MLVDQFKIDKLLAALTIKTYRFEGTHAVFAVACQHDGYIVASAMSESMDSKDFDLQAATQVAIDKVKIRAAEKLWELELYLQRTAFEDK